MLSLATTQLLSEQNRRRFSPALPIGDWRADLEREHEAATLEIAWIERLREGVVERASTAPRSPGAFVEWFEEFRESGPGQGDPLFPFLAEHATREQLRWFLGQEVAGEAGFEDLLALTQLSFEARPKLEMARNFWDEMGRGTERGMHGPMLVRSATELEVASIEPIAPAIELANLMSALARHRRYAYHSVGALGVIELTAPTRTIHVHRGLDRVGVSRAGTQYFLVHTAVDLKHSLAWNEEVLASLIGRHPDVGPAIAEGALLRLEAGARCFEAYRAFFHEHVVSLGPRAAVSAGTEP